MEAEIRAGHPDLQGLCLSLADWSGELRLLQMGYRLAAVAPQLAHVRARRQGANMVGQTQKARRGSAGRAKGKGFNATR